jgi:hypothetical protein
MSLTEEDKEWITGLLEKQLQKQMVVFATKEELERVETRLLTEFHKWASPTDSRLPAFKEALHTLDLEFDRLSDCVTVVEGRKSS